MTSILDDFKRREGESFGDDLTPSTAEASKAIIPPCANEITILTARWKNKNKPKMAKVWSDEKVTPSANVLDFKHDTRTINTLHELHDTIKDLANNTDSCVIRGSLTPNGKAYLLSKSHVLRRLHAAKDKVSGRIIQPHYQDAARSWCAFDIDGITTPYDITTHAHDAVVWFIEQHLPFLKNVGIVWKLSGSAGHISKSKNELRAHLWFLLDEPRTSAQVKVWVKNNTVKGVVDLALFNAVQAHYTADPVLKYCTLTDPCTQRIGIIQGERFLMPLVAEVKTAKKIPISHPTERLIASLNVQGVFNNEYTTNAARRALQNGINTVCRAAAGTRNNTLNSVAYYLYGFVASGALLDSEVSYGLEQAAKLADMDQAEIDSIISKKRTQYAPVDCSLVEDETVFVELETSKSNAPILANAQAINEAFYSLDDKPSNLAGVLKRIADESDPLKTAAFFVWGHYLAASNSPFRYPFELTCQIVSDAAGDKIHPLTAHACRTWARGVRDRIKERAEQSIKISDKIKRRHIVTAVDDLSVLVEQNKARVTLLRAGCGTGKTAIVGKGISDLAREQEKRFAVLLHRVSLAVECARVLRCTNYNDVGFLQEHGKTPQEIYPFFVSVLNSIASMLIRSVYEKADVLFIDEGAQMLRALVGIYNSETSTAGDTTPQDVYDLLVEAIRSTPRVVICDAGINDEFLEWLESILPVGEKVEIAEHKKETGDGINVRYHFNAQRESAQMAGITAVKAALARGENVWITVESVKTGRAIHKILKKLAHGCLISSQTPTNEKTLFLSNADVESLKYQYVIASPIISSGVSITHAGAPHFSKVFYFGDGSSVAPMDILQMIRRVRYVLDIHIYTWQNFKNKQSGYTGRHVDAQDFYSLKNKIQSNQNWERQNFNAALCYALEATRFNVTYHETKGDVTACRALYQTINEQHAHNLSHAPKLSQREYETLKRSRERTAADHHAIARFEINEHLAINGDADITPDDLRVWQDGRGREILARRAAVRGIALQGVEHAPVLVELYRRIFEGVDILNLTVLDQETAKRIVKNAQDVGKVGVQYELLPQSYAKKCRPPSDAVRSVKRILESCGITTLTPFHINKKCVSVADGKRPQERIYPLNTEKAAELDAIIDRYQFKITATTPLPDKVAKRDFGKLHPTPHHFYAANEDPIFADVSG